MYIMFGLAQFDCNVVEWGSVVLRGYILNGNMNEYRVKNKNFLNYIKTLIWMLYVSKINSIK